jgi:hypothetical protein
MLYKRELPFTSFQISFVRPFINDRDTLTKERTVAPKYCNTRTVRAHINKAFSAQFGKLSRSSCIHQGCLLSLRTRQSCCNGRERLPKQTVDLPSAGISLLHNNRLHCSSLAHQTPGSESINIINVLKFFCRTETFLRMSTSTYNYVISIIIISYRRFCFSSLHPSCNVNVRVEFILRKAAQPGARSPNRPTTSNLSVQQRKSVLKPRQLPQRPLKEPT